MEYLQIVELFAHTRKLDRLSGHGAHRKGRTAAGVAVELGQNDTGNAESLMKRRSHIHGILSGHGVNHQQDFLRLHGLLDPAELLHQLLVDMQPSRGIQNHVVVAVIPRVGHRLLGNLHRVALSPLKDGHSRLFTDHLQLIDGSGTVYVARHQQRAVPLPLQPFGQLGGMRRLAGALQTAHQKNARRTVGARQRHRLPAHQSGQLLVDNFNDHLRRRQALHHLGPDRPLGHGIGKILGNLIVDVRLQQRHAHLTHRVPHVRLRQLAA